MEVIATVLVVVNALAYTPVSSDAVVVLGTGDILQITTIKE